MKTIYKYAFPVCNANSIAIVKLPKNAEIIRLDTIDGHPYVWAIVDTEKAEVNRRFFLHKTGSNMDESFHLAGINAEDFPNEEYWMGVNHIGNISIWAEMELCLYVFDGGEVE